MTEVLRVEAGELSADEIIDALNDGRRILVDVELAGGRHEVVLRYDGETYLCDTPTNLHRHAEEAEMRGCIDRMGYADPDG
jgi:hemin uptake protein HemP